MSGWINAASFVLLDPSDDRLLAEEFSDDGPQPILYGNDFTQTDFLEIQDYITPWWPGGTAGFMADTGISDAFVTGIYYQRVYPVAGCNGRLAFVGVTRDQNGSALGGQTVRLYRVLTGELIAIVLSDANGNYTATTPYYEAHFLTTHFNSIIAGATVDNLLPS